MTGKSEKLEVRHNISASRFEIQVENHIAMLDYSQRGDIITFTHTGVPAELEGRGIGSQLARAGLEYAREKSFKVVPLCWFVAGYIERHPEYQDLLNKLIT
jgi:predicted GNAT family acetyltransferase